MTFTVQGCNSCKRFSIQTVVDFNITMMFRAFLLCLIFIKQAYSFNCPAGSYTSSYSTKCYTCPAGSYCAGDNRKVRCIRGYYAENRGSTSCKICPVGHSCYSSTAAPVKCSKGRYQDQKGQRFCKGCNYGEYNIQTGRSTKCDICPVGHSCYSSTAAPVNCSKGQYQDQKGQRFCKRCNYGEYNIQTGRSTKCDICPVGHSCYASTAAPVKCSEGQYQNQTGERFCKRCSAGEYNIQTGRSTKCDVCPVGHRCYSSIAVPVKCSKGRYQDQKGQRFCKQCSAGEYNIQTGRSTKCDVCPVGHRCYSSIAVPVKCSKGRYQDQKGQRFCKQCSAGEYNILIGRSTKCDVCPVGHSCYSSTAAPVKCSKGRYQDQKGQRFCKQCSAGEYNILIGRSTKCDVCPVGHRCYSSIAVPVKCSKGRYQDQKGQRFCKQCSAGEYNILIGRSTKCDVCPVGHRCYSSIAVPVKCSKGRYQDQKGQRFCKQCSAGEYNILIGRSTKCDVCPVGHSCYSSTAAPVKCSKGLYQDQKGQRFCKRISG